MNKEEIEKLIRKFNSAHLNNEETALLEKLIENGVIKVDDLEGLKEISLKIDQVPVPDPGKRLDKKFYHFLSTEKSQHAKKGTGNIFRSDSIMESMPVVARLSIAASILIAGFFAGFITHYLGSRSEINRLSDEISQMNETMMIALIEKPSATERLKAVSLTNHIEYANSEVIDALLNTLNHDDNVNVRLAAIDALLKYSKFEKVRKGMVKAIVSQESPLVQVALAEVMVALQEKSSVENLRNLLSRKSLNEDVREKINESIKSII